MSQPPLRAREIFEASLEVDPAERPAFLRGACGADTCLLSEVTRLLENDEVAEANAYLAKPLLSPARGTERQAEDPARLEPESIGGYELLGRVASGGSSTVYLARGLADQPAEVAIKVLRAGLPDRAAWRWRREGMTLARLDHPLIPRVFDSGLTASEQPFFVMEFVDGEPITEYCDRQRLGLAARIHLLLHVCDAVVHAHQHLVVHRDLKPTNILVDAAGSPRLLDFGIAKWLEKEASGVPATATEDRALTPEYAAPEQFSGGEITTATDVYSLGVLLYELLAGARPFAWRGVAIPHVLERWQRDRPTLPSATFTGEWTQRTGGLPEELRAERRGSTGAMLHRRLRGDLDNIVLMALRFEPRRRYGSVLELANDLRRFLDGQAVRARPSTWSYRVGKLLRRNRLVATQAALVGVLLVGFAVRTAYDARRVARQRDAAEEQARRAVAEHAKSQAVTDLLLDAYRITDPYQGHGRAVTAEEILLRGSQLSESTLAQAPELRAEVEYTLGLLYLNLGLLDPAENHLQRASGLGEAVHGADSVEAARFRAAGAQVSLMRNDFERAERSIRQVIEVLRRRAGDAGPLLGGALRLFAEVSTERGRYEDAESAVLEALEIHRGGGGRFEAEEALDLNVLVEVKIWRGELHEALAAGEEAVEASRRAFPPGSAALAESLAGRAMAQWHLRRFDEAMRGMQEAMTVAEGSLGEQHPSVAAISGNLGLFELSRGHLAAAEPLLRRAVEVFRARFDRPHSDLVRSQSNLARVLMQSGRGREALSLLEDCVVGYRALLGADHPLVAEALQHLGSTHYIQGQLEQAATELGEALRIRLKSATGDLATQGANRILLARVEREQGELQSARRNLVAALEVFAGVQGEELRTWLTAIGEMRLAEVSIDVGEIDAGEALVRRALAVFSTVDDAGHRAKRIECQGILGRVLAAHGRPKEAEAALLMSFEELKAASWASAEQISEAARRLVEFYEARGRPGRAEVYRTQSLRRPSAQ